MALVLAARAEAVALVEAAVAILVWVRPVLAAWFHQPAAAG